MTYFRVALSAFILSCCLSFGAFAQEIESKSAPQTKIESFIAKKGSLIVKDYYELNEVENIKFAALVAYGPGETVKHKGIRIGIPLDGFKKNSRTVFLDMDEVEELIKAIKYFESLVADWEKSQKKNYTEAIYTTRDYINFGVYKNGTSFIKSLFGRTYINPEPKLVIEDALFNRYSVFMDFDHTADLIAVLEKGMVLLATK